MVIWKHAFISTSFPNPPNTRVKGVRYKLLRTKGMEEENTENERCHCWKEKQKEEQDC